ncbi:MAG: hypothetical protein RL701_6894 [Pseudomonadota bacterium]|jgi:flagellar protein FlaG
MAIKSIDGLAAVDFAREPRTFQAANKRSQPPVAPRVGVGGVGGEGDKAAAEAQQQKPLLEEEAQKQTEASTSLRFKVDQESGKTVAVLVDTEGQILRQMPTEEALEVAKAIGKFQGMFVNLKV